MRTGDITHIQTGEGWLYVAIVLDLFNREVVGWSIKPRMTAAIVTDALGDYIDAPHAAEPDRVASVAEACRSRRPSRRLLARRARGSASPDGGQDRKAGLVAKP